MSKSGKVVGGGAKRSVPASSVQLEMLQQHEYEFKDRFTSKVEHECVNKYLCKICGTE